MTRAAIYTRISNDDTGDQTATNRQEEACRAYARAREWGVVEVFEDVDLSAYQPRVRRPAYERLLEAVAARDVDLVLVWKLDRLARRPAEFERFWASCEAQDVALASVTEPIDTTSEMGVAMVRILVTFAGLESTTKSLRIRAKFREMAEQGRGWSGRRPFGFTADWQQVVPEEAAAIQDAARRVLAGESVSSVARSWAAEGIRTTSGGVWPVTNVMPLLTSHRMVGDRSWHGTEVVATDCFPAILDRVTHLRLRRLAATRSGPHRSPRVDALLSGLLLCGDCGHLMHARRQKPTPLYSCPAEPAGCGRVHISAAVFEQWVTDQVLQRIREHPPAARHHRRFRIEEVEELVRRLEVLHHDFHVKRRMTRAAYLRCQGELDHQVCLLTSASNLPAVEGLPRGLELRHVASAWPSLDVRQRRIVIGHQIAHITVARPERRGGRFNPERLTVLWNPHRPRNPRSALPPQGSGSCPEALR